MDGLSCWAGRKGWATLRAVLLAAAVVSVASSRLAAQSAKQPDAVAVKQPSVEEFEVATIKPAAPSADGHTHINYPEGDRFSAANITLRALIAWAYTVPERQILGGPAWFESSRFDFEAKVATGTSSPAVALSGEQDRERKKMMVQALLAQRCGLKAHREDRMLAAYDLVLAKQGSRLQPSKAGGKSRGIGRGSYHGEGLSTAVLADGLSEIAGRVVVDKTQLTGRYDFQLRWTPDGAPEEDGAAPALFTAIQEQLGLRLVPAREPVPVLVIDAIGLPSAN